MTTRRNLLIGTGAGALTAPLASFAQQKQAKVFRIEFLRATTAAGYARHLEGFRQDRPLLIGVIHAGAAATLPHRGCSSLGAESRRR